ncbi:MULTISPECIES: glycoside hydrolase family 9 protein [unclassified Arcicella]|uniref:glycoside hydrolase family 9 protein n=1 Tax=unclassified Arcicella TaxID=2644986 RepID=UPI00285726E6|nr:MULTISPECIES: glycoside hydrolase family 9 protein [unclassified Arcicella]MDR6561550.1 endoglucanase [Arcicella sp. BE51]MDR6811434.1 endoglucanase [Arcicella sp. BE140]MDR6822784.1 endoglucanase [Arcicella sp. BE139]
MNSLKYIMLCVVSFIFHPNFGQKVSENIRLNQIGFYPNAPKIAVVVNAKATTFFVKTSDLTKTVLVGTLSTSRKSEFSEKTTQIADFSSLQSVGKYVIEVPSLGVSYPFEVRANIHQNLAKASLKAFYYQRASIELSSKYAGKWARPFAHPDTKILIHASAVSPERPEGTVISSPKGWYDAGDYNKYIVNSGITMGTLFSLYEDFPAYFQQQNLNIPESNNAIPDILDEALWNLRWMLTMQDTDGGVYHKLTNAVFDPIIMPKEATKTRYAVQKSTTATLDFAAVMAQAARVFKQFPKEFPALADSCLLASTRAWNWAIKNPNVKYDQNKLNEQFLPKITTGAYGDNDSSDEFFWAATELYITTKDDSYYNTIGNQLNTKMNIPSWNQVRLLGYYTFARFQYQLTGKAKDDFPVLKNRLLTFIDTLAKGVEKRSFQTVMGRTARDFMWGSSGGAANQGIAMIQAFKLTKNKKFLDLALSNLDYLLGRNGTGYSFMTAFGSKTPMHPHHRLAMADGIVEPLPGFLSGGANPGQQDKCVGYTTKVADESYLDADCSYSTNEIAINWNAPMAYLSAAIEALQSKMSMSIK